MWEKGFDWKRVIRFMADYKLLFDCLQYDVSENNYRGDKAEWSLLNLTHEHESVILIF